MRGFVLGIFSEFEEDIEDIFDELVADSFGIVPG
jgi:hypothetical protein